MKTRIAEPRLALCDGDRLLAFAAEDFEGVAYRLPVDLQLDARLQRRRPFVRDGHREDVGWLSVGRGALVPSWSPRSMRCSGVSRSTWTVTEVVSSPGPDGRRDPTLQERSLRALRTIRRLRDSPELLPGLPRARVRSLGHRVMAASSDRKRPRIVDYVPTTRRHLLAHRPKEASLQPIRGWMCLFAAIAVCAAWGGSTKPIDPGGKIGTMIVVKGTQADADAKFFDFCDPVILKPGRYARACAVPHAIRLFVGYGDFAPTRKAIDLDSAQSRWDAWIDGHHIDLPSFGTSDRTLYAFPAAGGKDVILREWRVMLLKATPGKHTLRYRNRNAVYGTVDATWTFTVGKS
jgi:hypothetical protein